MVLIINLNNKYAYGHRQSSFNKRSFARLPCLMRINMGSISLPRLNTKVCMDNIDKKTLKEDYLIKFLLSTCFKG